MGGEKKKIAKAETQCNAMQSSLIRVTHNRSPSFPERGRIMSPSSRHCPASLSTLRRLTSSNLASPRQSLPRPRGFGNKSGLLSLTCLGEHQPQQQSQQFRASDWSWSRSQFHPRRSASGIWCVSLPLRTTRTLSFPPSPSPSFSSSNSSADISISRRLSLSFSARLYSSKHNPPELLDESSTTANNSNDESEETEFNPSTMPSC